MDSKPSRYSISGGRRDDYASYAHPGQEHLWVEAPLFGSPYLPDDGGLEIASERVLMRISELDVR
ncbi:hypothetical protein D7Y22_08845 [Stenotrophomonas maltophilia]|nr:hypothetical protein [Stenotrophomonas maltophilia]